MHKVYIIITTTIISLYFRVVLFLHPLILILSLNILILSLNIRFDGEHDAMGVGNRLVLRTPPASNGFDGEHDAMGVGNRLVLRTPPASNGPKCTCTVVAVYPVTSAYHARDSTCHAHSLAFVKFEVPFLPIDPKLLYSFQGRGMGGEVWVPNGCTILQMRPYLLDI